MEKNKEEKDNNPNNILDQDFFDTIKLSKKINSKISKINELTEFFKKTPNYIDALLVVFIFTSFEYITAFIVNKLKLKKKIKK